ncbi:MAG: hypothetical protein Kow0069_00480 [Promethearchaeota archaeon]
MLQLDDATLQAHTLSLLDVDFLYYLLMFSVLSLWLYFGLSFYLKGVREKENLAQKSYQKGFGIFITCAVALETLFVADSFLEEHYDLTFFNSEGDYGLDSIVYSDFFVLAPAVMFFSLFFLLYPVEKYMLKRSRASIATVNVALAPFPFVVRYVEVNLDDWFGVALESQSLPFFAMTVVWVTLIGFAFLSILVVMALYGRMARAAPKGSKLRRKCWYVIFGLFLWATGLFSTGETHNRIWAFWAPEIIFGRLFLFWTPFLLIISLLLLASGFSREY